MKGKKDLKVLDSFVSEIVKKVDEEEEVRKQNFLKTGTLGKDISDGFSTEGEY